MTPESRRGDRTFWVLQNLQGARRERLHRKYGLAALTGAKICPRIEKRWSQMRWTNGLSLTSTNRDGWHGRGEGSAVMQQEDV